VGFAELLAGNDTLDAASRNEYCSTILENAQQLQNQIHDMLEAARIEGGTIELHPQDVSATEIIEAAIVRCRKEAARSDVTIHTKLLPDILLRVDTVRLRQSLTSLIANAVKFSVSGGIVNIETSRTAADGLLVSVRDAGLGIPEDRLSHIFEPFEQAEGGYTRAHGGLGLGLSNARAIARMHGGDVRLQSAPGAGTTADLKLPAECVNWDSAALTAVDRDVA
jgi:signal transduction histidine kinase